MNRRSAVRTGVRAAVGVVALAVGAVVIGAASTLPLPSLAERPAGRVVDPVALDQQRVCTGSLLRLAGDTGASATSVSAIGSANVVTAAGDGVSPSTVTLEGADGAGSKPQAVTARASGSTVPQVAGAQSQTVSESDLRGFAAAPCAEPTSSTWLVGGSTETGRTTLIDLVNPSDVNSTVDLTVAAENGAVEGPGLEGIVVAPRSQKVVPLSGFQTGLVSPVVHVTSRGGLITASLQEGVVRTLDAGGADIVSAAAGPSTLVTVPGIVVRDGQAVQKKTGDAGFADLKSILRAYVPGSTNAQLSIQLSTADGTGTTFTATAQSGRVTDVSLDGLDDGLYTATIRSSEPVVAGVRTSSVGADGGVDLAWTGGAPQLGDDTMFTVAPGSGARLTLANPTAEAVTATLTTVAARGGTSRETTIQVPANSSTATSLTSGDAVTLTKAGGLRGAVSYSGGGQIAAYPLFSTTAASTPVKVYP
jgi:hypothetical protein